VLDNAALHAEVLREERLRQELALARDIQQGFMPSEFGGFAKHRFELVRLRPPPARGVSGDLYDFLKLPDGRLSVFRWRRIRERECRRPCSWCGAYAQPAPGRGGR